MNLEHIDPKAVIDATAEIYRHMKTGATPQPPQPKPVLLSRQVQALAYVLVGEINDKLLEIENASE